jgi:predicted acylesterase/phospholipase RssA
MDQDQRQREFEQVFKSELHHIRQKPGKEETTRDNLVGLSLSGGGIRSASFALGVIHSLVANDKLSKIDYLSTVSGGGYIGSALTWALHKNKDKGEQIVKKEGFPLGVPGKGSTNSRANNALNYIRQQANYLTPGGGINLISCCYSSIY